MEKKILVVDDEESILVMLMEAFRGAGYDVKTAENAEKALDILRQESIMVMYLDLKLPGMDGIQLCKQVRVQNPVAFICAVTGHADLFSLLECLKAGFNDFFLKPVTINLFLVSAQEAFRRLERWSIEEYELV